MQYTKGHVTCEVHLTGARQDKLMEVLQFIPKCVKISSPQFALGTNNRHTLVMQAEYGPVWGGWESDIRKKVIHACKEAGTSARLDIHNLKREVVAKR